MASLTVTRVKHDKFYKIINVTCVEDNNLSWQAKGLHNYLITRPKDWNVWEEDLVKRSTNGRDSLYHARKELLWNHYLYIIDIKVNGCFRGMQYLVFEVPEENEKVIKDIIDKIAKENPEKEYRLRSTPPRPEKPSPEKPFTADPTYNNKHNNREPQHYTKEQKTFPYGKVAESKDSATRQGDKSFSTESFEEKLNPSAQQNQTISSENIKQDNSPEKTINNSSTPHTLCENDISSAPPPPAPKKLKYPDMDGAFDDIIDHWNRCAETEKNMSQHKVKGNGVHNRISYYLNCLTKGTFHRQFDLSAKYCKDNGIAPETLRKVYSPDEIKQVIDWYVIALKPDMYSRYKDKFPRSFADFLYNESMKTSFFMSFSAKGEPQPVIETPLDQKAVELYVYEFFRGKPLNIDERKELMAGVNFIVRKRREYHEKIGQWYTPHELQGYGFYRVHIAFIRERFFDTGHFDVSKIRNSNNFTKFSVWLKEKYGKNYDLEPTRLYTEMKRKEFEEDQKVIRENEEREERFRQMEAEREARRKERGPNRFQVGYAMSAKGE